MNFSIANNNFISVNKDKNDLYVCNPTIRNLARSFDFLNLAESIKKTGILNNKAFLDFVSKQQNQIVTTEDSENSTADENKWSKANAYQYYIKTIRKEFPWYNEVSSRVTRNAINDLDSAFSHFFRRLKEKKKGVKLGFPKFKKKNHKDSFSLRESVKFDVLGNKLRIEKLKSHIKMREKLRFTGKEKQVTISKRAGKYFVSILVETNDLKSVNPSIDYTGVHLGIKNYVALSDGKTFLPNQKLKKSIKKLAKLNKNLSKKNNESKRYAKAKLKLGKLHYKVAKQRESYCHEISDYITSNFKTIVIEDLHVKGMVKNRRLARSISDAGFGMLRQQLTYKSALRGNDLIVAPRFFASSKTCSKCGKKHEIELKDRVINCDCGNSLDRDTNAAINLENYGRYTFKRDLKRTEEECKTKEHLCNFVDDVYKPLFKRNE